MRYIFKKHWKRFFVSIFDFAGRVFVLPFRVFAPKPFPKEIKRILIIRLDHIGDVIYATSIPRNLKLNFPGVRITFLVGSWAKDILTDNPYIDEIICFDAPWFDRSPKKSFTLGKFRRLAKQLRQYHFDLGFDLRGDLRHILLMYVAKVKYRVGYGVTGGDFILNRCVDYDENTHALERNLALLRSLNIAIASDRLQIDNIKTDRAELNLFLKKNHLSESDTIVLMHPCAGTRAKNWRNVRFTELADILAREFAAKVLFVGSSKDRAEVETIVSIAKSGPLNVTGETSLSFLLTLIKKAKLFVGVDSGPSHLAASLGIPTVVLYSGTNKAASWAPRGNKVVVIQKEVACKECEQEECIDAKCMDLISVQDVLQAVRNALEKEKEGS